MVSEKIAVGIPVCAADEDVHHTIESVYLNSPATACPVLLATSERDASATTLYGGVLCLHSESASAAELFNLLRSCENYTFIILLEQGALAARGWLEPLLHCLRDPETGAVGPSTNLGGGIQQAIDLDSPDLDRLAACAAELRRRYGRQALPLDIGPGPFCYGIRRELAMEIGPAHIAPGPDLNFTDDYNRRLQERGLKNRWVCSSLVYRKPGCSTSDRRQAVGYQERQSTQPSSIARLPIREQGQRPLVSCIMPTFNRRSFVSQAIRYFLRQNYGPRELIVVDDGSDPVRDLVPFDPRIRYFHLKSKASIGSKRNFACEQARGEIILHWDDDDWHSDRQISYQAGNLLSCNADVCGFSQVLFYDVRNGQAWQFRYPPNQRFWVHGNSLCYRRSFWQRNRFQDIDVGEDVRFLWNSSGGRMLSLDDFTHHISMIHDHNVSPKNPHTEYWNSFPSVELRRLLGEDLPFYRDMLRPQASLGTPLVSCIMPTFNRRPFIPLALASFRSQTYPLRELVVVDDGPDSVADLLEGVEHVKYVRVSRRMTIGAKRNLARRESCGDIIAHWDDDDWYAPRRLEIQLAPILAGYADLTGLVGRYLLQMPVGQFWEIDDDLHRRMFVGDVTGCTLVYSRICLAGISYPEVNLAEDAGLLNEALRKNKRLARLENQGLFVYLRHDGNTWQFSPGKFLQTSGWKIVETPPEFPLETLNLYRAAAAPAPQSK